MINRIILVGRLVADPEMRTTSQGVAVANMRLAVDRKFRDQDGNRQTDFINIVAWRKTAELCKEYLSKGKMIGVEGSLRVRTYQDKDGNNRTAYEVEADSVQFLEPKGGAGSGYAAPPPDDRDAPPPRGEGPGGFEAPRMEEDDLPF